MTNRKLGCTLPAARPLWPTAPTVWTPSLLSLVVFFPWFLFLRFWLSWLSLNTNEDERERIKGEKRKRVIVLQRRRKLYSRRKHAQNSCAVSCFASCATPDCVSELISDCLRYIYWVVKCNWDSCLSVSFPAEIMVWFDPITPRCQSAKPEPKLALPDRAQFRVIGATFQWRHRRCIFITLKFFRRRCGYRHWVAAATTPFCHSYFHTSSHREEIRRFKWGKVIIYLKISDTATDTFKSESI